MRSTNVLLCALLVCAGCRLSGPAQTVENYYPFAVGNRWTYTWGDTTNVITETIVGVFTNAHNVRVYEWQTSSDDATYSAYIDGQVVFMYDPDDTLGAICLKEPFEVGAFWHYDPLDTSSVCRVEDTRASVATHAGEFENCIKVSTQYEGTEEFAFYFAPGVGMVKRTAPGEDDVALWEYDLK